MRFLCFGDWGMVTTSFLLFVKEIVPMYEHCIVLGDNFYPGGVESLNDSNWRLLEYFPKHTRFYGVLGNHDYMGDPFVQIQYTYWKYKIRDWNMDYFYYDREWRIGEKENDTIQFLFIDTALMDLEYTKEMICRPFLPHEEMYVEYEKKQLEWLYSKLERSKSKWKVVCGHYPIFSNGGHKKSLETTRKLLPILNKYSVDIYLSGHDHVAEMHHYEKTIHIVSGNVMENRPINTRWGTERGQSCFFRNPYGDHGVFDLSVIDSQHLQISYISQDQRSTLFFFDLYKS